MKIIARSGMEYVPEWNGNRKEKPDSQVVVEWNYLSGSEREAIFGLEPIRFNADGEMPEEFTFRIDTMGLMKKSIKTIRNLTIQDGEKEREAIIEDICNMPELGGLYKELHDLFMEENRTPNKKK